MSFVAVAEEYARGVVDGEVLACKWVRLACQRQLKDLTRQRRGDFPYRFDEAAAEGVCRFLELLPHTKGKWASARSAEARRIHLEAWQVFFLTTVFGWVHKRTGFRRFRTAYLCVPRKNGKSIVAAGVGLYMFAADGEHGAEVYSGATTEKQAWEVFRPAKLMAERTPELCAAAGIGVHAKNLHIHRNGSRFEPVIGKPGDGASPSCAIVDEYHEHATDELVETMVTGMGAREQPLLLVITTAGDNIAGPCYALQSELRKVLEGSVPDEELFGIIYTIDEGDDWTSEEALKKANPNYGVSVGEEFLRSRQQEAVRSARKQGVFKTKHLNVWVTARQAWMNMEAWNAQADPTLAAEAFAGESCWVGLDLASKVDLAAAVKVFRREEEDGEEEDGEEHYYAFGRYYLPEERSALPECAHYQAWAIDGHVTLTEGDIIDFRRIRADLEEDAHLHQVEEVGYDPYNAAQLAVELQEEAGLTMTEVPQNVRHLSDPMKWVEALVLAGRLHHDGNPALAWMMSNVVAKVDANDNVYPRKERGENKIDGAVALIIAIGRAMVGEGGGSVYEREDRGFLLL